MKEKSFFEDDKKKILIWVGAATIILSIVLFFAYGYLKNIRKISLKDYSKEEKHILVQAVQTTNGKYLLVDNDSTVLPIPSFDEYFFNKISEKYSREDITTSDFLIRRNDSVFLFSIKNKNVLISENIQEATRANENLIAIKKNNLYGFINLDNDLYIQKPSFTSYRVSSNSIICERNGKKGLLNSFGELLLDFNYDFINDFGSNYVALYGKGADLGVLYFNGANNIIENKICESCSAESFENGFLIKKDGLMGLTDKFGTILLDIKYQNIYNSEGDYFIQNNGKTGLYNAQSNFIIEPIYDEISKTTNGYFIKNYGRFGFLNSSGAQIIGPNFDQITCNENGSFLVRNGAYYGVVNSSGNQTIPCDYLSISFSGIDGYAKVKTPFGKFGWLNYKTGETIIEPIFERVVDDFSSEYSIITVVKDGETKQIRPDGRYSNGESIKDKITRWLND